MPDPNPNDPQNTQPPVGTPAQPQPNQQPTIRSALPNIQEQPPPTVPRPAVRRTTVADLGSDEALNARLARAKEQERKALLDKLKEGTGLDDPDQITARWKELQSLEQKEAERKRNELSEIERFKADLARERQAREAAEANLARMQQEREYDQRNVQIQQTAGQYVDPSAVKLARIEFAEHIKGLPKDQQQRYEKNPKLIDLWFKQWSKKNPRFSREAQQATTPTAPVTQQEKPAAQPTRRPITNGSLRRASPPATSTPQTDQTRGLNGKTVKPGRTDSMSPREVKEYAAKLGVNYPGS